MAHDHELSKEGFIPDTIEAYAASDQITHDPIPPEQRPSYYFRLDNQFPPLPEPSIRENWSLGRINATPFNQRMINRVVNDIMAATYDGALPVGLLFADGVHVGQSPQSERPEPIKPLFTERQSLALRVLLSLCVMGGAVCPPEAFQPPPIISSQKPQLPHEVTDGELDED